MLAKLLDMISTIRWRTVLLTLVALSVLHLIFIDDTLRNSYSSIGIAQKEPGALSDAAKVPESKVALDVTTTATEVSLPANTKPVATTTSKESTGAEISTTNTAGSKSTTSAKPADNKPNGEGFYANEGSASASEAAPTTTTAT